MVVELTSPLKQVQILGGWSLERITWPNDTNRKKLAAMTEKEIPATVNFEGFIP